MFTRRSIRLKGYDYTQNGAYFITICTYNRLPMFGEIVEDGMRLNQHGKIVVSCWDEIPQHYPNVELDVFVVMPNHVHGIVIITTPHDKPNLPVEAQYIAPLRGATPNNVAPNSLGSIVRSFKGAVTRNINRLPNASNNPIWQRNYYEHIIRNEASLDVIRNYVVNNPAKWAEDSLNI